MYQVAKPRADCFTRLASAQVALSIFSWATATRLGIMDIHDRLAIRAYAVTVTRTSCPLTR